MASEKLDLGLFFDVEHPGIQKELKLVHADGKPSLLVTADGVMETFQKSLRLDDAVRLLESALEKERAKIRRLMKALTEEVLR